MKKEDLIDAIGFIDGKYILEAETEGRIKKANGITFNKYQRWISLAACLCILVIAGIAGRGLLRNTQKDTTMESAQISDYAATNEDTLDTAAEDSMNENDLAALGVEEIDGDMATKESITGTQLPDAILERDLDKVKKVLKTYPDTYDDLLLSDAFVNAHGNIVSGQDSWDDFYANVEAKKPAQIVIAQFTDEGDAILNYLNYDGNDFYRVEDDSRDSFAGQGELYRESIYKYLKIYDISGEDEEDRGDAQILMLIDDDTITYEEMKEYWDKEEEPPMKYYQLMYISVNPN